MQKILKKYWYRDLKSNIQINRNDFVNHLTNDIGLCYLKENDRKQLSRIKNNIIYQIEDTIDVANLLFDYLDNNFDAYLYKSVSKESLKSNLISKSTSLLNKTVLGFIPIKEIKLHFDSAKECYFYFRNIVVKVIENKITLIEYSDLDSYVMTEQVIDRDFNLSQFNSCKTPFKDFIFNVSEKDESRFLGMQTLIGYLLHRHIDLSKVKVVALYDGSINEINETLSGSVGKGLLTQALGRMRNTCEIEGKKFQGKDKFGMQRVTTNTNIVCINDAKQHQNLEDFYGITDGFVIEQKYKPQIYIQRDRVPKIVITSNYIIKAPKGHSSERRMFEFEFSKHYGKHRNPFSDFGHYFFQDWNNNQWDEFALFMFECVQQYLKNGLIEVKGINLDERRLITEVGLEYIDFFDDILSRKGEIKLHKKELHQDFINENQIYPRPKQRTVTMKLTRYLASKSIKYIETPKNNKTFIEIVKDDKKQEIKTIENFKIDYKTVDTKNKISRMIKILDRYFNENDKLIALDLETTSLDVNIGSIVCLALSVEKHKGYNIIFPKDKNKVNDFIKPLLKYFKDSSISKVFHNYKFDRKFLDAYDIKIEGTIHDTLILDYLLDPNRKKHGLKEISKLHLGYEQISFKEMLGDLTIIDVPVTELTKYAVEDVDLTLQLFYLLRDKLIHKGDYENTYKMERRLTPIVSNMETTGIKIDLKALEEVKKELMSIKTTLTDKIEKTIGKNVNINSTEQLSKVLFEDLEIKPITKKKSKKSCYSVDKKHLNQLKNEHSVIGLLLKYRKTVTLLKSVSQMSTVNIITGRLHANFNQIGTATGRFSSSKPNMQNIPNRSVNNSETDRLKILESKFREIVIADKGNVLVGADYSQIELRVTAEYSQDPFLLDAYQNGLDIHTLTASQVFEISPDKVTSEKRQVAKVVNFGLIYGKTAFGLASTLTEITGKEHSKKDADDIIIKYFNQFPKVKQCLDKLINQASKRGYSKTLFGRMRPIPELNSSKVSEYRKGKRLAMNSPIQGTASDIIKLAMIKLDKEIKTKNLKAKLILQVHDEILIECPISEQTIVEKLIKKTMENAVQLSIPLEVDLRAGHNWAEVH